jgi:tellurite resistance protein TehA-like permease
METDEFGSSKEQAAAALAAAEEARAAGFTPIPSWFLPAVGVLIAGVMALQAIDPPVLGLGAIAVLLVAYVVVEKSLARRVDRTGAAPRDLTLPQQLVLVGPLAALWIAGEILDVYGGWVWLVVAGITAAWTIGYGVVHNRRARG